MADATVASSVSEAGPQERFFRYFQHEVTALQAQMERLEHTPSIGGERADAIDHCLAGIARLSNEVKDASVYLPAYDQRAYSEAIKALSEELQRTRATFAPKPKFSFKTTRKNNSAISLNDAAEIASAQRLHLLPGYRQSSVSSPADSSFVPTPEVVSPPSEAVASDEQADTGETDYPAGNPPGSAAIRKPSFSHSTSVNISSLKDVHIILPSSASHATSSGSLTSLRRCVVDMSVPTASGQPFAGLTIKGARDSLFVSGHVNGPAHITGVDNSVVLVACRQLRMHDCRGVDVYLLCASRPIIENCAGVRFAPLPERYILPSEKAVQNQWDQVDDFKWLKAEHSPNWEILTAEKRIVDNVWKDLVPGGPGISLEDILSKTVMAR